MKTYDLVKIDDKIYRILHIEPEKALVIDCINHQMPVWIPMNDLISSETVSEKDAAEYAKPLIPYNELTQEERRVASERSAGKEQENCNNISFYLICDPEFCLSPYSYTELSVSSLNNGVR